MASGLRAFPASGLIYGYRDPVVILSDGVVPLQDLTDYTGETVCVGGVADGTVVKVKNGVGILEFDTDGGDRDRDVYRLQRFAFRRLIVEGNSRHMEQWELYAWVCTDIEPRQVVLTFEIIAGLAYWGWGWRG